MLEVNIDASKLLKYVKGLEEVPERHKKLVSDALNEMGAGLVNQIEQEVSKESGLSAAKIGEMIHVKRAYPNKPSYEIDLGGLAVLDDEELAEGLEKRDFPTRDRTQFRQGQLVKVLTAEDDKVCPACEDIAEHGPYPIEDARTLIPHHPHCRCLLVPYVSMKRLPVQFQQVGGARQKADIKGQVKLTMRQLAERVAKETTLKLRVK